MNVISSGGVSQIAEFLAALQKVSDETGVVIYPVVSDYVEIRIDGTTTDLRLSVVNDQYGVVTA